MLPYPRLASVYRTAQRAARRAAVMLSACFATAAFCTFGLLYTSVGLLFSGAAFVLTGLLAGAAWLVSGE